MFDLSSVAQKPCWHVDVDTESRCFVLRVSGIVGATQMALAIGALVDHPRYDPSYNGLFDVRAARTQIGPREFKAVVDVVRRRRQIGLGRRAFLIRSPKDAALAMIYGMIVTSHESRVFTTEEAANAWLGKSGRWCDAVHSRGEHLEACDARVESAPVTPGQLQSRGDWPRP
jgi:hypothetical protein